MDSNSPDDLLQFKDFSNSPSSSSPPPAQISVNSPTNSAGSSGGGGFDRSRGDPLSDLIYDMTNTAKVLAGDGNMKSGGGDPDGNAGGGGGAAGGGKVSFLTLEYYQRFFDVDSYMVLERIANSMIPKRAGSEYLRTRIGTNPDLYGPFWINVTLIFSIAITGNIASYLSQANDNYKWHYNFHLVSYAATCIFIYVNIFPAVLWGLFKYSLKPVDDLESETAGYTPSLLTLMCIYGYSTSIYIPISILWVIQISIFQWLLVIVGTLLSAGVLILVLTPALRNSRLAIFLMALIVGAHFLISTGFMLYFFHMPKAPDTWKLMTEPSVPIGQVAGNLSDNSSG